MLLIVGPFGGIFTDDRGYRDDGSQSDRFSATKLAHRDFAW